MAAQPFAGVRVPVLTPFTAAGEPDAGRFIAFCRLLLDQGADGLAIFGTTSEANSMSAGERMALLDRLVAPRVPRGDANARCGRVRGARGGDPDPPCRRTWRWRRPDAAAVLLQGHGR